MSKRTWIILGVVAALAIAGYMYYRNKQKNTNPAPVNTPPKKSRVVANNQDGINLDSKL